MIYAAWLVVVIWGLLSLPLFLWLLVTAVPEFHTAEHRGRTRAIIVVALSDVLCATAIGWLLRGQWLVSLLVGAAFFLLRMIFADWVAAPEARNVEISLSGAEGEFREHRLQLMRQQRQLQLLRLRVEEARQKGERLAPAVREHLPQRRRLTPAEILGLAGFVAACGVANVTLLAALVWLMGHPTGS